MTFEEVWSQVKGLPDMAMKQVPKTLSDKTKKTLAHKSPEDVATIVKAAIYEIDHGSIERLDTLVQRKL